MEDLLLALSAHSKETYQTIASYVRTKQVGAQSIDPYLSRSVQVLTDFSLRGGKAIRPFVASLAYELAGGKEHPGLSKAVASIELHHKHILILDDIADRDETRYGGPTVEYAYRELLARIPDSEHKSRSFAMLDSVLLASYSKEMLLDSGFEPKQILDCFHILNTTMYEDTLAGWQIHGMQCAQALAAATEETYIKGLRLVTARYTFAGPFQIGLALAGNHDAQLAQALDTYADAVGTAFQIHDDILGLFGDTSQTGKPVGNDVREGKKTLLLQTAYARGSSEEKAVLETACGKPISSDMLRQIQAIVNTTGSHEYSTRLEKDYIDRGVAALSVLPSSPARSLLIDLAHYIITREK